MRIEEFKNRPLVGSPCHYVRVDALCIDVREGSHTVSAAVGVATAVNNESQREIIAIDIFHTAAGASWATYFRKLIARVLSGAELVVSDCHLSLKAAIEAFIPKAVWQRY